MSWLKNILKCRSKNVNHLNLSWHFWVSPRAIFFLLKKPWCFPEIAISWAGPPSWKGGCVKFIAATFPVCSLSSTLLSCAVVLDNHMDRCAPGLDPLLILQGADNGRKAIYSALQGSRSWKHIVRWCWETGLVLGKPGLTDKTMTSSTEAFSNFSRKKEQEAFGEVLPTFSHKRKCLLSRDTMSLQNTLSGR